ncbi:Golgi-associated plant pathogenesis-related 1-like protein [Labeo rohita]|uniref:Golgi-associated plant pathogenesis-related 1-like protein n=1 Tax=Labeo rohita TaxID=84645 RepID=A0A498N530_LABRO|nr:Golgi-associated plant pathogenesis-related 1-like protein [Labeo rohita]
MLRITREENGFCEKNFKWVRRTHEQMSRIYTGKAAVDSWYSEIKDYTFSTPGNQPGTGLSTPLTKPHIAQIVREMQAWVSGVRVEDNRN